MNNPIPCEICDTIVPFNEYIEHCEECYIQTSIMNRNNQNMFSSYMTRPNINSLTSIMSTMINEHQNATITMIPIDIERLQMNHQTNGPFAMNTMIEELNGGDVNVPVRNMSDAYTLMEGTDLVTCSICYDESTPTNKAFVLTICNHVFCKDCISRWLNMRHKCPVCMNDFNEPNESTE